MIFRLATRYHIIIVLQVFDHMLKRMSYRRQKRWWNAYMLFYCRADLEPGPEVSQ